MGREKIRSERANLNSRIEKDRVEDGRTDLAAVEKS
jgi:hypothetical protein